MNRLLVLAGALAIALVPTVAQADVANDPCDGLEEGDDCTTLDDKPGTCVADGAILECTEEVDEDGDGSGSSDGCSAASSGAGPAPFLALAAFVGGGLAAARLRKRKQP